jgi:hypothetical protein
MLALAEQPDIGVVGAQLLYPDGKVQHAGMFLAGRHGMHAFRFAQGDDPGYFGLALTERNVIAVTGACMLSRREAYDQVGGFNEAHSVVNNDLDYCLPWAITSGPNDTEDCITSRKGDTPQRRGTRGAELVERYSNWRSAIARTGDCSCTTTPVMMNSPQRACASPWYVDGEGLGFEAACPAVIVRG